MVLLNYILTVVVPSSVFLLGLMVFINNPKSATNKLFLFLAVSLAVPALGSSLALITNDTNTASLLIKLVMVFGSWVPTFALFFISTFPKEKLVLSKYVVLVDIFLSTFFSASALGNLLYKKVEVISAGNFKPETGPILPIFGLFFAIHLATIAVMLTNKFRHAMGREKEQFRYLTYGLILMILTLGIFDISFILVFNNANFTGIGVVSLLFFEGAVFYSITRHRLMDIRLVVARTVAYTLLVGVIGVFYVVASFLATSLLFKTTTSIEQIGLYTVLTIIVAFTFQPLRHFLEEATDKIFYKGRYDSEELLTNLTKVMVKTLGLKNLTEGLIVRLLPEMRVSKGAIVLLEKGKVDGVESAGFDKKTKFVGVDILALMEPGKVLVFDEINNNDKLKKIMEDLDVAVAVPFKIGEEELGVMILGNKLSGEIYTDQDIDLLEILAPETSIAIKNARAYEEIRKFSIHLQEEVAKATTDLRSANERLKELDKAKDDFVSIASHELRTPMTAIKSYVWLALHNRAGELNERLHNYLDKVYTSSERMIALISDMLNVSRIETGRIQMEIGVVSVYKVIDMVASDLSAKAGELGVTLNIERENIIPLVKADRNKLAEILTNLAGNSLKFTPKGGKVTIAAKKADNVVEISVTDTGVGISKENMAKLFAKFGRIESSYATAGQAAATGTGLGLWISKNYIEKMGGKIRVDSTLGKGTTFTFSLPIAADAKEETPVTEEKFVPRSVIT